MRTVASLNMEACNGCILFVRSKGILVDAWHGAEIIPLGLTKQVCLERSPAMGRSRPSASDACPTTTLACRRHSARSVALSHMSRASTRGTIRSTSPKLTDSHLTAGAAAIHGCRPSRARARGGRLNFNDRAPRGGAQRAPIVQPLTIGPGPWARWPLNLVPLGTTHTTQELHINLL